MPTIHVLAPHHTILNDEFSHCAFSGKARRFAQMMKPFGYTVHEYANKGSESQADVKHVMLNEEEFKTFFKHETSSPGAQANPNTLAGQLFRQRLEHALREYARPGDVVAHIWTAYWDLPTKFPNLVHVETGIGYPNDGIGCYRIFESYAWQHFHWARYCSHGGVVPTINGDAYQIDRNPACTWVVPNYYDPADWPFNETPGNNVVFMARFVVDKGIVMLRKIIKRWHELHPDDGLKFVLAGMGGYAQWLAESFFTPEELARIDYRGVVNGPARAEMVGNARAMLLPSIFVEPFGGSGVESMMCFPGTTVVRSPRVERVYRRKYTGQLLRIRAGGVSVECTPEHPFLTHRGWTPASRLRVGDKVARSAAYAWPASVHSGRIEDVVDALPELRHPYDGQAARTILRVGEVESSEDGTPADEQEALDSARHRDREEALCTSRIDSGWQDARTITGQRDAKGRDIGSRLPSISSVHGERREDYRSLLLVTGSEVRREIVGSHTTSHRGLGSSTRIASTAQAQSDSAQGYVVSDRTGVFGRTDRWRGDGNAQACVQAGAVSSSPCTDGHYCEYGLGDDGVAQSQNPNTKYGSSLFDSATKARKSSDLEFQRQRNGLFGSVSISDPVSDGETTTNGDACGVGGIALGPVPSGSTDETRDYLGPDDPLYEWASVEAIARREVENLPVFNLGTSTGTYEAAGFLVHNCGTPLLAPDFGAFTETIEQGVTGFRCRSVDDYIQGIENSVKLDRRYVSQRAKKLYSLEACGAKYHDIFTRLTTRACVE